MATSETEKAFLAEIRKRPSDLGPRLVYADWLSERGDPRGEFIHIQCQLAGDLTPSQRAALTSRQDQLTRANWSAWIQPYRMLSASPIFTLGFVETVEMTGMAFLRKSQEVLELSPLLKGVSLKQLGWNEIALRRLQSPGREETRRRFLRSVFADRPIWRRISELDLSYNKCPEIVFFLLDLPDRSKIHSLNLTRNKLDDLDFLESKWAKGFRFLQHLSLARNDLFVSAAEIIATSFPYLKSLDLWGNSLYDAGAGDLASSHQLEELQYLDLSHNLIGDDGVMYLSNSGSLRKMSHLILEHNRLTDSSLKFLLKANWPLERLELGDNGITEAGVEAILASPLAGSLKRLDLRGNSIKRDFSSRFAKKNAASRGALGFALELARSGPAKCLANLLVVR